jgi:glycosyltransferase involved in cell wall biosynthesis
MRLLIDLQGAQSESRYRGIGRYSIALARALIKQAADRHEISILLNGGLRESIDPLRQLFDGLLPADRFRVFDLPLPAAARFAANQWRARAAALIREDFIAKLSPDAVLVSSLFEGLWDDASVSIGELTGQRPFTAVVHYDLIPHLMPQEYLADTLQRAYYQRQIQSLLRSNLLLAISEHSRQEVIHSLNISPERVCTIMSAADPIFSPSAQICTVHEMAAAAAATNAAFKSITRYPVVCAPGGFDARKNIERLIQAYALLSPQLRSAHQLVIASRLAEWQYRHLLSVARSAGLSQDELIMTGYLRDTELVALYRMAQLFVFPSLHEGFGLPVLEAMACGAPVIGSNTTSIPEVIAAEEALFDPHSITSIASTMDVFLSDDARRDDLRQHCLARASLFSWERTAGLAIEALERNFSNDDKTTSEDSWAAAERSLPHGLSPTLRRSLVEIAAPSSNYDWLAASAALAFHHPTRSACHLLVDISEIVRTDARTGIQRVVRALLLQLLQRPPQDVIVMPIYFAGKGYRVAGAFTRKLLEQAGRQDLANEFKFEDALIDFYHGDVYFALDLNTMTAAAHAAHLRMKALGVRCCFVVYDILPARHPEWWPASDAGSFAQWLSCVSLVADRLVCISRAVADDLEDWLASQSPKGLVGRTRSFHLGADIADSVPSRGLPPNASNILECIAERPSFLMVGTLEPRKGHAQVLSAFEAMWEGGESVNLVIVGKRGWLVDSLIGRLARHPQAGHRLFWLEAISDEYLDCVYATCTCLIAASEGEGFGLPLIEAARHGIPILARDLPVFREVTDGHAIFFSGLAANDIQAAVTNWLQSHSRGLVPSSSEMARLTWQESADQLLAALDLSVARPLPGAAIRH